MSHLPRCPDPGLVSLPARRPRELLPLALRDTELRVSATLSTVVGENSRCTIPEIPEKLLLQTQLLEAITSHVLGRKGWAVLPQEGVG